MTDFNQKKSLDEFSDHELLLFILSNQVNIYREIERLKMQVETGEVKALGHYSNTFKELVADTRSILQQANEHMNQSDSDKGFLKF